MVNDLESIEPTELDKISEEDLEKEVPTSTGLIVKLLIILVCFGISAYIFKQMYLSPRSYSEVATQEISRLRSEIMVLEDQAAKESGQDKEGTLNVIASLKAELQKLENAAGQPQPPAYPEGQDRPPPVQVEEGDTQAVPDQEDE